MKGTFVAVMACAVAFSFAGKCNFDSVVSNYEKRLNFENVMKGSSNGKTEDEGDGFVIVWKKSNPLKSGKFMGLVLIEKFGFNNCVLSFVVIEKEDPKTNKNVSKDVYHMRPDGSFKALCPGAFPTVMIQSPYDNMWVPNKDCTCLDKYGDWKPSGKYGCMDSEDIEKMNSMNEKYGGPLSGSMIRNGKKVE